MPGLEGKIALVTGATRGLGKGIALQLASAGALVYITGRTMRSTSKLGSLEQTAQEISDRGGKCIPVQVDHEKDEQIKALFDKIDREQNGKLDILVNNAYKGVNTIFDNTKVKFWEQPPEVWDDINNVGLRNHYICTVYAARLMVPKKQGLIVFISSFGGSKYLFNVAYGIGKAAVDRMAADCGIELKKQNVTSLSLMVGAVKTELIQENYSKPNQSLQVNKSSKARSFNEMFDTAQSPEFAGKCIVALAQERHPIDFTSKVVFAEDYAQTKGLRDIDGRVIDSYRQLNYILKAVLPNPLQFITYLIPNFVKVPKFVIALTTSKF